MRVYAPKFAALILATCIAAPLWADSGHNHQIYQTRPISLGTSGGNVNDHSNAFCCAGTLGSLVSDAGGQYILSNNHVLARVNQAAAGEAVSQPGAIDLGCNVPAADYVANLTRFVPIDFSRGGSNVVDCAIAKVISGDVKTNGDIIDIGQVSSTLLNNPPVNTGVKKSGRTTGLTTGTVTGVNGTFSVQYQLGCGSGKKTTATFVNQVVFSNLSSGGDSGSLIVENTSTCPRPVALLFAGSSSTTIGNPISAVLSALNVSMVGGSCPSATFSFQAPDANDFGVQHAIDVQTRATERLMQIQGVVGTAVGKDEGGRFVVQVYVEHDAPGLSGQIPGNVEDLSTKVIVSGPIEAY